MPTDLIEELKLLVRSRYGLVSMETVEIERVESLIRHLADQLGLPLFQWSRTRGLQRDGLSQAIYGTDSLQGVLAHINASSLPAVYLLVNVGSEVSEPATADLLRNVAQTYSDLAGVVFLVGDSLALPPAVRPLAAPVVLPPPRITEYRDLLKQLLRDIGRTMSLSVHIAPDDLQRLLNNLKGLTLMEAEKVLTKAIIVDQALTAKDIARVIEAKKEIVEREGLLEYYPVESSMGDIAGLDNLKQWLRKRRAIVTNPSKAASYGLSFPKGVLLVGIPGSGKSLCAKAVAKEWSLPLLKMDPGSLYNKYVGETERNFRCAMDTATRMAPVILWIDEIEKAFSTAGDDGDGGVSTRVLGTFLSWLQEREGDVFVVATANDVSRLPPELLRKGRFDEIFFVDLPDTEARKRILDIHLTRRNQPIDRFDLAVLADACPGFTGADIEQSIVSGLYTSFDLQLLLNTEMLLREFQQTRPLTQTMPERIAALREWARDRTVPANATP